MSCLIATQHGHQTHWSHILSNHFAAGTPESDSLYNKPSLNITFYQATTPPSRTVRQLGLWDAGNNYIAAARAISDLPAAYLSNFSQMPQWNYVIDNAPVLNDAYLNALDLKARPSEMHAMVTYIVPCMLCCVCSADFWQTSVCNVST